MPRISRASASSIYTLPTDTEDRTIAPASCQCVKKQQCVQRPLKSILFAQPYSDIIIRSSVNASRKVLEFIPQGSTINKKYYLEVMSLLCKAIRQKRIELQNNQSWILQHDNAPVHTLLLEHEILGKNKTVIMPQAQYLPDLQTGFYLFPKLKTRKKGKCFATIEVIKEKSKQELLAIPKITFQKCFKDWKKRCNFLISPRIYANK